MKPISQMLARMASADLSRKLTWSRLSQWGITCQINEKVDNSTMGTDQMYDFILEVQSFQIIYTYIEAFDSDGGDAEGGFKHVDSLQHQHEADHKFLENEWGSEGRKWRGKGPLTLCEAARIHLLRERAEQQVGECETHKEERARIAQCGCDQDDECDERVLDRAEHQWH